MKIRIFTLILLIPAIFMAGCTKEPTSDCEVNGGCAIAYEYAYHNGMGDLIGSEIDRITVFVFDENDIFISRHTFSGNDLPSNYTVTLPLPAGNYTIISLGGSMEAYIIGDKNNMSAGLIAKQSTLEDFRIALKSTPQIDGPSLGEKPSALFYSKDEISIENNKQEVFRIGFMKNSSTVLFRIVEKFHDNARSLLANAMPYTLYCLGKQNLLNHENEIPNAESSEMKYIPYSVNKEGNTYETRVDMMRLITGNPVNIILRHTETGRLLVDENLLSFIFAKESPYLTQSDMDKEDLFVVDFEIDNKPANTEMAITIKIAGWPIAIVIPDF